MAKQKWVSEKEAAAMINRHPRYLRAMVKEGRIDVSYRTGLNGRDFEYDANAIEAIKNRNAVIIHA